VGGHSENADRTQRGSRGSRTLTPEVAALLAHARAKIEVARVLLAARAPGDAASRAYYAAFHAVSAALLARGQAYSSHAQVLGAFNRDFVHAGTFPREYTVTLTRLFEDRQTGDYDPTTSLEQAEAERDVQDAERIVEAVAAHLAT
jgi:uncharacterized protein (UPF0332 family)